MTSEQQFNVALAHHQAGRLDSAEPIYRQILQSDPNHAPALQLLGLLLHARGDSEQSIAMVSRAAELEPANAVLLSNLTVLLNSAGRYDDAIATAQRAIRLAPYAGEAHANLANALMNANRFRQAIATAQQAVSLNPNIFDAWFTLGYCYRRLRVYREAARMFAKSAELEPEKLEPHLNLAIILREAGDFVSAENACRRAMSINPNDSAVHAAMAMIRASLGRSEEAHDLMRKAHQLDPAHALTHSGLIFQMHSVAGIDPMEILAEAKRWEILHSPPKLHRTPRKSRHDKIRVGYFSPDLCDHVIARFLLPILQNHDRSKFEIYCYSDVPNADTTTGTIRQNCDHWRDICELSDTAIAGQIDLDEIDILVDLTGHTADNRMSVFATRPAPVQISYLGYPGTTGLSTIDFRLTDEQADPAGLTDSHFTEKLIRLPRTAWCYQPTQQLPPVTESDATANRPIRFGCFNKPTKISAALLSMWKAILDQVEDSQLILKFRGNEDSQSRQQLIELLVENHIDPSRIGFLPFAPTWSDHLQLHGQIDIALDTFPYHGTTTTCDALLMGVPVITLAGQTHVSRVGASLLHSVGLDDLVARSPAEYVEIAKRLANNRQRIVQLRQSLRNTFLNSPLSDGPALARDIENAFSQAFAQQTAESEGK